MGTRAKPEAPITSALVLVGDEGEPTVTQFAKRLTEWDVPFERATGIVQAVAAAREWKRKHAKAPMTTVDFVGHAMKGRFFFSKDEVLTACPDMYTRLGALPSLIDPPERADKTRSWGLRLIGCDVSNEIYTADDTRAQNGTVLQVALAWFLQMPVWAPKGAILEAHFDNKDRRVQYEILVAASLSKAIRIPKHVTPELRIKRMRKSLSLAIAGVRPFEGESSSGPYADFDFTEPRDATGLVGAVQYGEEIPKKNRPELTVEINAAWFLFDRTVLVAQLLDGRRVAYIKKAPPSS